MTSPLTRLHPQDRQLAEQQKSAEAEMQERLVRWVPALACCLLFSALPTRLGGALQADPLPSPCCARRACAVPAVQRDAGA